MRRLTTLFSMGLAGTLSLVTLTAFGADLTVTYNSDLHRASITNNLSTQVVVLYLKGTDGRNYDAFAKIDQGGTVTVRARQGMPGPGAEAICQIANPPPNYSPSSDGSYHLSVQIQ